MLHRARNSRANNELPGLFCSSSFSKDLLYPSMVVRSSTLSCWTDIGFPKGSTYKKTLLIRLIFKQKAF